MTFEKALGSNINPSEHQRRVLEYGSEPNQPTIGYKQVAVDENRLASVYSGLEYVLGTKYSQGIGPSMGGGFYACPTIHDAICAPFPVMGKHTQNRNRALISCECSGARYSMGMSKRKFRVPFLLPTEVIGYMYIPERGKSASLLNYRCAYLFDNGHEGRFVVASSVHNFGGPGYDGNPDIVQSYRSINEAKKSVPPIVAYGLKKAFRMACSRPVKHTTMPELGIGETRPHVDLKPVHEDDPLYTGTSIRNLPPKSNNGLYGTNHYFIRTPTRIEIPPEVIAQFERDIDKIRIQPQPIWESAVDHLIQREQQRLMESPQGVYPNPRLDTRFGFPVKIENMLDKK
jgi:hypothetical protein